ncbi:MAG: hypothetical protein ACFE0J_24750 [Elainellaceae cyanobacterium]
MTHMKIVMTHMTVMDSTEAGRSLDRCLHGLQPHCDRTTCEQASIDRFVSQSGLKRG